MVLPGDTEHIGQVEGKVDDSTTGCCQISSGECSTEQEALHDRYHGIRAKEEEDHPRVAVRQQVSFLLETSGV